MQRDAARIWSEPNAYILRSQKHVLVWVLLFTQLTDENHTDVSMQHK